MKELFCRPRRLRNSILILVFPIFSFHTLYNQPASAFTIYCSNCGNWWTQLLEKTAAVQTQLNTAKQLQESIKQSITYTDIVSRDITPDIQKIIAIYNEARSISHYAANLDKEFHDRYKDYKDYLKKINSTSSANMTKNYEKWADNGLENARVAMASAKIHVSSFDDENTMLEKLINRSGNAESRMQALQAANEIASLNVQQLQKLSNMLAAQMTMQANYMAIETERRAADDATREQMISIPVTNSRPGKGF